MKEKRRGAQEESATVCVSSSTGAPRKSSADPGSTIQREQGLKKGHKCSEARQQCLGSVSALGLAWIAGGEVQNFCRKCRNCSSLVGGPRADGGHPEDGRDTGEGGQRPLVAYRGEKAARRNFGSKQGGRPHKGADSFFSFEEGRRFFKGRKRRAASEIRWRHFDGDGDGRFSKVEGWLVEEERRRSGGRRRRRRREITGLLPKTGA